MIGQTWSIYFLTVFLADVFLQVLYQIPFRMLLVARAILDLDGACFSFLLCQGNWPRMHIGLCWCEIRPSFLVDHSRCCRPTRPTSVLWPRRMLSRLLLLPLLHSWLKWVAGNCTRQFECTLKFRRDMLFPNKYQDRKIFEILPSRLINRSRIFDQKVYGS